MSKWPRGGQKGTPVVSGGDISLQVKKKRKRNTVSVETTQENDGNKKLKTGSNGKQWRLLIIDDDEATGFCLKELLELEGYIVETCQDGWLGLEKAITNKPDLVILDLMIPGISGEQVLAGLREKQMDTPVILVSAFNNLSERVKGLSASHYHTKPFSSDDILRTIRSLLK